jgi:transcriptional regulator with XRE-family HTH domain
MATDDPRGFRGWLIGVLQERAHLYAENGSEMRPELLTGVAAELGVSPRSLGQWLSGDSVPLLCQMLPLARFAGVPVDAILLLFMEDGWLGTVVRDAVKDAGPRLVEGGWVGVSDGATCERIVARLPFLSPATIRVALRCALDAGTLQRFVAVDHGTYEVAR